VTETGAFPRRPDFVFLPARSKLEAVTRISALTHSPPESLGPGSKERKSALVNLAIGLAVDADTTATKPELGRQLAAALGVPWNDDCWSAGDTITLVGLNRLLSGAQMRLTQARRQPQLELFGATDLISTEFIPARSKLEAVTRISALTQSPPETLGPGSKERKSALVNLASGLELTVDASATKPDLGGQIAAALSTGWDETCWSAGQTITLTGLNRLLGAAEERLRGGPRTVQPGVFDSPAAEASALLEALAASLPSYMDGRSCVEQMLAAEFSQWAQDEWAGFYFEFCGLPAMINGFGGGPATYANTRFDYSLGSVWDLKVHAALKGDAPLNAIDAVDAVLSSGRGLGFIVLSGTVEYDDGAFRQWHRERRLAQGKVPAKRHRPKRFERKSKTAFTPRLLQAFYIPDRRTLEQAERTGAIRVLNQGRQTDGSPRHPKWAMSIRTAAVSSLLLTRRELRAM
jgi:hypothetical protein